MSLSLVARTSEESESTITVNTSPVESAFGSIVLTMQISVNPRNFEKSASVKSASVSIILLAAGGSSRLGQPKQLLRSGSTTLVRKLTEEALAAQADEVIAVLGAEFRSVRDELAGLNVRIVENVKWKEGISTSILTGLDALSPERSGVLFMSCDQPRVTRHLLRTLILRFKETHPPVVACEYGQTIGIPALFSGEIVEELRQLRGDSGAKSVILRHVDHLEKIPFPEGELDIDRPDDLRML